MASQETSVPLSCAQCETSPAILECFDEELLYCAPCSATLHSKKARAHHIVKPFRACDECEAAVARLQCAACAGKQGEPLVFCADCSGALHSKKARLHHQVELISSSSLVMNAAVQNDCKAGEAQEGDFHAKTEATSFARTEKGAFSVEFEQGSLPSSKQEDPLTSNLEATCLNSSVGAPKEAATEKEAYFFNVQTAPRHGNSQRNTLKIAEENALINVRYPSLHATTPREAHVSANEESFQKMESMNTRNELGENNPNQVSLGGVEISSPEKAAQISTKKSPMYGMEGISLTCPTTKMSETASVQKSMIVEGSRETSMHEAIQNETEGPLFGNMEEGSMNQQHHGVMSSKTQEATKSIPFNESAEASQAGSPAGSTPRVSHLISTTQGVHPPIKYAHPHYSNHECSPHARHCSFQNMFQVSHTPPPCQNHLHSHCTPFLSMHHMAEGIWPVRALDFSQNAFHSSPCNGGCVPPLCQSCAPSNAQRYMPFSSQCHTGFTAQVDRSSSEYDPPMAPVGNSDSIHSKFDNQCGPTSYKRIRSVSNEVNAVPPNDIQGCDCNTNVSKRMQVGESISCVESLNQVHNEGTRENIPSHQNVIASSEEPSKNADHPSLDGLSSQEKFDTDGSIGEAAGERDSQNTCSGTGLTKITTTNETSEPSTKLLSEAQNEKTDREACVSGPLTEKITTQNIFNEVSKTVLSSGTEHHDKLFSDNQVNTARKDCGSNLESDEPTATELGGSIVMEKARIDTSLQSAAAPPNSPAEKNLPLQGPVSDLVHKIVPVENGPVKEFHLKKDETENLSTGALLEAASSGNAPFDSWSKMATAIHRPKEELLDNDPGEAGPLEVAACTLPEPYASLDGGLENDDPTKGTTGFIPKQELTIQDSNAPKRPRKRLRKMHVNNPSQPAHNPLLERWDGKEPSSRESSEPSYHQEDSSAEDETFHAKKYRRGTITLEAFAMIGVRDPSYGTTGHIFSILKRGLRCSTPDEDARQALRNAQRKVTKANLKQVIFYGIEQNANCAAVAFAAIFNRISIFSADYIPEKLLDAGDLVEIDRNWECANKGVFSRKSRMAYRNELMEALFKISKQQRSALRSPKLETVKSVNNVSIFPTRTIWMQGIPKSSSLVKKYGHETIEALIMQCEKACRNFVEMKGWTIVASRLKDPVLW